MRICLAYCRKEWQEQIRSGRMLILGILFFLFGVMNPAVAKLTPWLLEAMADSMAESGMIVTSVSVDALTSWTQFYKNIPMALIVFILIQSSVFTREYGEGTLIVPLTKGLARWNVVLGKAGTLLVTWTAGYWLCYGVTFGYNAWFWDNAIAQNLLFSAFCWWLFGVWTVMLTVLYSVLASANAAVLCGVGATVLAGYLVTLFPKLASYSPAYLMNAGALMMGTASPGDYTAAVLVTLGWSLLCMAVSIPVFNRKQL